MQVWMKYIFSNFMKIPVKHLEAVRCHPENKLLKFFCVFQNKAKRNVDKTIAKYWARFSDSECQGFLK